MADHSPLYMPGTVISVTASAPVTGGQVLEVSGNDTVGPAGAASVKVVGVAAFDAAANSRVAMHGRGQVHRTPASGAITAGARVAPAANGRVASIADGTAAIGVAMTTAADGAPVVWMEL